MEGYSGRVFVRHLQESVYNMAKDPGGEILSFMVYIQ